MNKTRTITHAVDNAVLLVTGEFTPRDPGVRYHKDGSGTPPDGPYFEISDISCQEGDLTDLINDVEEFCKKKYEKKLDNLIVDICKHFSFSDISKKRLEELRRRCSDSFENDYIGELEEILADKAQGILEEFEAIKDLDFDD